VTLAFVAAYTGLGFVQRERALTVQRELAAGEGLDADAGDALKEVVTIALKWSDIVAS
jgi:hypothetical protein